MQDGPTEGARHVVGCAEWLAPVNRTATNGAPLPKEVAEAARVKSLKDAINTELDLEWERARDQTFYAAFKGAMAETSRSVLGGRPHWTLYAWELHSLSEVFET